MIELFEGEKIILQKRRHWYILASETFILLFAAIVPIAVFVGFIFGLSYEVIGSIIPLIILGLSGWLLILWVIFFIFWTNYYLDVLIITNERVIDIEQKGLFARDTVETSVRNIQDVRIEVLGIIATLWDFGNIHIQTASASKEIVIRGITNPYEVRKKISEQYHQAHE